MHLMTKPLLGSSVAVAAALVTLSASADVTPHAGMIQFPDVGPTDIVFVYANDLWIVPRAGGQATPLASPAGAERFPRFSADGSMIAFVGNYDGDRDLYTIGANGGQPNRITHHPSNEVLCDWTPDGKLMFATNGLAPLPHVPQLFTVGAEGGLPEKLPVPYGGLGSISADGQWLAYVPFSRDTRTWKRYRGGMASDIWLFDLNDHTSKKITDWEGTDSIPMWHGDNVYYLSDGGSNHRLNIWMYNTANSQHQQVTNFADYDVKWPSIGPGDDGIGEIVFQNGASLYLLDLRTGSAKEVEVAIPGDRPSLRAKSVDAKDYTQWWQISPTGKRAVVEARGDVWTLPAENGTPRNLTRTSGVAERSPAWSTDGRWIAYFSDATGEYELYITQSDGKGETKQLTFDGERFRRDPRWSPDSKHIVFTDNSGSLYLHTIESGETRVVDSDPWNGDFAPSPSWSHDSQWLTFARTSDEARLGSIWLYNVESGEKHKVTSDMFHDSSPTFDRKGDYLYYTSHRSFSPKYGDLDTSFIYDETQILLAVPLRADMKSPWVPEVDEESWGDENDEGDEDGEEQADDADGDDEEIKKEPVFDDGVSGTWECTLTGSELPPDGLPITITLAMSGDGSLSGSVSAIVGSFSMTSGTYDKASGAIMATFESDNGAAHLNGKISGKSISGTITVPAAGIRAEFSGERTGIPGADDNGNDATDEEARETVDIDLEGFERRALRLPIDRGNFSSLSVNNKNELIYLRQNGSSAGIKLVNIEDDTPTEKSIVTGARPYALSGDGKKILALNGNSASIHNASAGASGKPIMRSGMTAIINPREEWMQILTDAWRIEREYFYDPNMHDVDWPAVHQQYAAMLEDCATRDDVSFVIGEMIAEINVGHAYYRGGGDTESQPRVAVGLLGVDFERSNGAYRIAKIIESGPWDSDARGPLCQPGVDVKEGDFLLAVNGIPLDMTKDPWAAFLGMAGRTTVITVSDTSEMNDEAREVTVTAIGNESNLRYRAWIEKNRAYVQEQTGGKVGYIYVPDTGVTGQNDLVRQFYGQLHKEALIIDERWNRGGQVPTRFIELLNRPATNSYALRHSNDWTWPPDSHQGPKCMLINGMAGSGGDLFPYYFKQAGLGKLIGMRTWGGLVGISGSPILIDGAQITAPAFAFYENDGTWGLEGHGVDPDIEVVDDPALMVYGGDPQLDAGIEHILQELAANPYVKPARPAYPDRSGMGITEEDK